MGARMSNMRGPRLLRAWRVSRGLSQRQAGAHLGITKLTVCLLEGGERTPHLINAFAFEDATDGEVPARSWAEPDDQEADQAEAASA